jgi:hypothetical protein
VICERILGCFVDFTRPIGSRSGVVHSRTAETGHSVGDARLPLVARVLARRRGNSAAAEDVQARREEETEEPLGLNA